MGIPHPCGNGWVITVVSYTTIIQRQCSMVYPPPAPVVQQSVGTRPSLWKPRRHLTVLGINSVALLTRTVFIHSRSIDCDASPRSMVVAAFFTVVKHVGSTFSALGWILFQLGATSMMCRSQSTLTASVPRGVSEPVPTVRPYQFRDLEYQGSAWIAIVCLPLSFSNG